MVNVSNAWINNSWGMYQMHGETTRGECIKCMEKQLMVNVTNGETTHGECIKCMEKQLVVNVTNAWRNNSW